MTTLAQARSALNAAQSLNTAEAWQAAALAFAAASEAKSARKPVDPTHGKHTGKTPIMHVGRCTLADGYSVRVSIGQFKGETIADSLARLERFTRDCYIADHQPGYRAQAARIRDCIRSAAFWRQQGPENSPMWHDRMNDAARRLRIARRDGLGPALCNRIDWGIGTFDRNIPVPETAECTIVKYGSGPDAGIDIENPPMLAAAE